MRYLLGVAYQIVLIGKDKVSSIPKNSINIKTTLHFTTFYNNLIHKYIFIIGIFIKEKNGKAKHIIV